MSIKNKNASEKIERILPRIGGQVRVTGLEPARYSHQNLNLARLPIPPHPQTIYKLSWRKQISFRHK